MAQEHKAIVNLSTAPNTLSQAEGLLTLAKDYKEHRSALCGCVTVMAAFALEQAINSAISFNSQRVALEMGIPAKETPYPQLSDKSFRVKMRRLPDLLTEGQFTLNYRSGIPDRLEKLITMRNRLAHVEEPARPFETRAITVEDGRIRIECPMPDVIWTSVSTVEAEQYVRAVDCYLKELLFPGDAYEAGGVLVSRTRSSNRWARSSCVAQWAGNREAQISTIIARSATAPG